MTGSIFRRRRSLGADKPTDVDRLIIHQFDPLNPSPGGIDTCIRGLLRYADAEAKIAVVGVDAGRGAERLRVGIWEKHKFGDVEFSFLPVAKLDPANQSRLIPHSLRLALGVLRYWIKLPSSLLTQTHRADLGTFAKVCRRGQQAYFIHTQQAGLTNAKSDSIWKHAPRIHELFENRVVKNACQVAVFNPAYANSMRELNPLAEFSPTWFDPALIVKGLPKQTGTILWVGRMEVPKDPQLAIQAFALLHESHEQDWRLRLVGDGQLAETVREAVQSLPDSVAERIEVCGRQAPGEVARSMAVADVFLMTSHPGYEGYPRVLVEAMANGLKPVVTSGSDTGSLVQHGVNGFVAETRDPEELAKLIRQTAPIDSNLVKRAVTHLDAPSVVSRLLASKAR